MKNHDYILSLCQQLAAQGAEPTVAMIRNKAHRPLAIPEVIAVLKRWKQDPQAQSSTTLAPVETATDSKPSQTCLENRVTELEAQVEALTKAVAALTKAQ
ncbi:hypothetical protein LJ739_01115 [Aestuariibacter halophilus]|uniref:KfrA N-terminal DNA-binding domain-containing protein n=1 Tax=Fluctibacter halophilus TaxID=226011 RepID=A0ABS8G2M6_9ALTE|nr:hypothetical protein [Aestuariibacter halophilus]MCC2614837.1 hypothetical protein [Aestuariibacter halophilus]